MCSSDLLEALQTLDIAQLADVLLRKFMPVALPVLTTMLHEHLQQFAREAIEAFVADVRGGAIAPGTFSRFGPITKDGKFYRKLTQSEYDQYIKPYGKDEEYYQWFIQNLNLADPDPNDVLVSLIISGGIETSSHRAARDTSPGGVADHP